MSYEAKAREMFCSCGDDCNCNVGKSITAALAAAHAEGREEACRLVCTYCDLATQDLSGDHVTCGAAKILGPNAPWYHKWADLSPDAGVPVAWRKCEASRIRSAQ